MPLSLKLSSSAFGYCAQIGEHRVYRRSAVQACLAALVLEPTTEFVETGPRTYTMAPDQISLVALAMNRLGLPT